MLIYRCVFALWRSATSEFDDHVDDGTSSLEGAFV